MYLCGNYINWKEGFELSLAFVALLQIGTISY